MVRSKKLTVLQSPSSHVHRRDPQLLMSVRKSFHAVLLPLGIHTPIPGGKDRFVEKVVLNLDNITNTAPITTPAARWNPIPPRTLREATDTPIKVRIKIVKGSAVRR